MIGNWPAIGMKEEINNNNEGKGGRELDEHRGDDRHTLASERANEVREEYGKKRSDSIYFFYTACTVLY